LGVFLFLIFAKTKRLCISQTSVSKQTARFSRTGCLMQKTAAQYFPRKRLWMKTKGTVQDSKEQVREGKKDWVLFLAGQKPC